MVFDILQKLTNTINTGKTNTNKDIIGRKKIITMSIWTTQIFHNLLAMDENVEIEG